MDDRTDLGRISEALRRMFTHHPPLGYLRGKTAMRNALEEEFRLSELEAEELIDTLEMNGIVRFEGDPSSRAEADTPWAIDSAADHM